MKKTKHSLSLAELHERIENGIVPTSSVQSALAFLGLAKAVTGSAFYDAKVLASEEDFATWFPHSPNGDLVEAFGDAILYNRCRASVLRHAKLAGAWPEKDPYTLLNLLAKKQRLPGVNRKQFELFFPGLALRDLTRNQAIVADRPLRGNKRMVFRRSLSTIDRLRSDPRVLAANILCSEDIGPMPIYRDGDKVRIELPKALAIVIGQLPISYALHARRAFELGVDFGILGVNGPRPGWSLGIAEAARYYAAVQRMVSSGTATLYLSALLSLLRTANSAFVHADVTTDRVRRPEIHVPKPKSQPSHARRKQIVLPAFVETEVASFAQNRSASPRRIKDLRWLLSELLKAGYEIDSRRSYEDTQSIFETTFPDFADLTLRSYQTVLRTFLAHTNRLSPWESLITRAQATDVNGIDLSGLLLIKRYAENVEPPVPPAKVDEDIARQFLTIAFKARETPKLLKGLASLDHLRTALPDFLPGPTIGDQRDWLQSKSGKPPEALENALRSDAQKAGYTKNGVRAMIVAVRSLYSLTPDKTKFAADYTAIPWRALTAEAMATHEQKLTHYRTELLRLADRLDRIKTVGWQNLQVAIVAAGIPRADNPIDTLMSVAANTGLEPWHLDREWAWIYERSLRPDLRRKWNRAVTNFDALYDTIGIAQTKLLPSDRLGPMPQIGARLKNAHFPLPRRFEAALEGGSKQLLEAGHFVWRCLRTFGVCSRGDDPAPGDLVADDYLDLIEKEQCFMRAQTARLHIECIRDWRDSQIGLL